MTKLILGLSVCLLMLFSPGARSTISSGNPPLVAPFAVPREILEYSLLIEEELARMEEFQIVTISEKLNQKGLTRQELAAMRLQIAPEMQKLKQAADRIQRLMRDSHQAWEVYKEQAQYQYAYQASREVRMVVDTTVEIFMKFGDLAVGLIEIYDANTGITDDQFEKVSKNVGIAAIESKITF